MAKEQQAMTLIEEQLRVAKRPIVLCSFGKDSIVLLHMCLRVRKVPVLFFRFAKFQEKNHHALQVAQKWDLEVYDPWPIFSTHYQSGTFFEVLHSYSTGQNNYLTLFSGIKARTDETRYLCAVDDLLLRPKVTGNDYPWDVTFHGHKGTDDPEIGAVGLISHSVSQLGNTLLVVPFIDWTDQDIWEYIHHYNLPYDTSRYDEKNDATSPDKYPTCYNCLDVHHRGTFVPCPKLNRLIPSQALSPKEHEDFRQAMVSKLHYCEVTGEPRTTPNDTHL